MKQRIITPNPTQFRAYELGTPGSSFSYFSNNTFTLIEARLTERSEQSLFEELKSVGKSKIDVLHITSWDDDHCKEAELATILEKLTPGEIQYPGYQHSSENYKKCLRMIKTYESKNKYRNVSCTRVTPEYINSLKKAEQFLNTNIFYHPKQYYQQSNDNSLVKLFRTGMFNVASLGDIESGKIGAMLKASKIMRTEVDVLILAHHGAENEINTRDFFQTIDPSLVVCTSDFNNEFDHPRESVRKILRELEIPLFTTKTGDILIRSVGNHVKRFQATNLCTHNENVSSIREFESKKFRTLIQNKDTLKNRYS